MRTSRTNCGHQHTKIRRQVDLHTLSPTPWAAIHPFLLPLLVRQMESPVSSMKVAVRNRSPRLPQSLRATGVWPDPVAPQQVGRGWLCVLVSPQGLCGSSRLLASVITDTGWLRSPRTVCITEKYRSTSTQALACVRGRVHEHAQRRRHTHTYTRARVRART